MRTTRPAELTGKVFFTKDISVGDFVGVDEWTTIGCVFEINRSSIGGESSVDVHMQLDPCSERTNVFRLEDGQFWIEG